jgi:hypothetical protein
MWPQIAKALPTLFYQPDIEAFHAMLSVAASHYLKLDDLSYPPTWLLFVGPPGTRKTSQLKLMSKIPNFHFIDQPNSKGFLSGFDPHKNGENSLLHKIGPSGFLGIADMSTILNSPDCANVLSILRRIYDGDVTAERGQPVLPWHGRITLIGCATTEIDSPEFRDQMSTMGDRFVTIWTNRMEGANFAAHVVLGAKPTDATVIKDMIQNCFQNLKCPKIELIPSLEKLSSLIAITRTYVKFDRSYHKIERVGDTETPSRLITSLHSIAFASAAIDSQPAVRPSDIHLAERVGWDTIPRRIYHTIKYLQYGPLELQTLQASLKLLRDSFESFCARLMALNICETKLENGTEKIELTHQILSLLQ